MNASGEWIFQNPAMCRAALLLAGAAVVMLLVAVVGRSGRNRSSRLRVVAPRLITVALLLLVLSGPSRRTRLPGSRVVFLIDRSARLEKRFAEAAGFVRRSIDALPGQTPCGVLVAGHKPDWVIPLDTPALSARKKTWSPSQPSERPGSLALALNHVCKILKEGDVLVLVTDGWTDPHALLTAGGKLRAARVRTFLKSLGTKAREGVFVASMTGPRLVREGDLADFRVVLSNTASEAAPGPPGRWKPP